MASETLKIDANDKNVAGAVTDNAAQEIRNLRIDDATKGLKVMIIGGSGAGQVNTVVAGTGISVNSTDPVNPIVTNTLPDQTVALTGAGLTTITGTYPNFTISSSGGAGGGDVFGPATNTADYIPQWNGTNSKTLKNGVAIPTGGLAGLTSPTFATSITGSYLTASQILITDGSSNIVSAPVATYPSLTELSYVKGVTSGIQSQINAKGAGTVTSVGIATANGVSGSGAITTSGNITVTLGAITPTSVNGVTLSGSATPTLAVTGTSSISGSNTGDNSANSSITPTSLGLVIGTNVQAYNSNLTAINQALTTTSSPSFTTVTANLTGNASGSAGSVAVGGITGLGTGVATALAINVGTAGAPIVNGGALGTPSSGSAANLSSFPTLNQDTTGKSAKTDALNSATTVVNVSSATAPTNGQALIATSSTAATWQLPTGYTLWGYSNSSGSPANATLYYFGFSGFFMGSIAGYNSLNVPKAGTIKTVIIQSFYTSTQPTSETSTVNMKINGGSNIVILNNTFHNDVEQATFNVTGLSTAVAENDVIEFNYTSPTWSTRPGGLTIKVTVYIE